MHRKSWGTCRSPKSYNLSLDCPLCFVLFKMADKIPMSQRALPKVTSQRYISSQRYIPNNVTLKKRTVCILWPMPAFGWAPVKRREVIFISASREPLKSPPIKHSSIPSGPQISRPWLCAYILVDVRVVFLVFPSQLIRKTLYFTPNKFLLRNAQKELREFLPQTGRCQYNDTCAV